jgi:hypothetical protein
VSAQLRHLGRAAKPIQINPNQSKQIQAKRLGFAWFYSSESGLFNGLRRIQIKKSLFGLKRRAE